MVPVRPPTTPPSLRSRSGFTMVEVMVASALVGFSLIVMFGFHNEAVRSNTNARRMTDCAYLAQTQMERLLALEWRRGASITELTDRGGGDTTAGLGAPLELPTTRVPVNSSYSTTDSFLQPASYTVTWDVTSMDSDNTWVRLRVRCTYGDSAFRDRYATTISSFRYRDT
ncbi:MAG: hypothetical protein RLZZ299_1748 [Pseudomonadota bacterium]